MSDDPRLPELFATASELTPTHPRWKFTTELVDHLPASATVPTTLETLGYEPGTSGKLARTEDLARTIKAALDKTKHQPPPAP